MTYFPHRHASHGPMVSVFSSTLLAASMAIATAQQVHSEEFRSTAAGSTAVIEEVTVTAQRRSERSLDVPISITAIGADQLGKGDVQQLSDIMKLTPGLRFDNASAFAQPTIRGVGTAVAVAGGSSNVGIYTDGFYSPNPLTADSDLLNVDSVQVLKGPQGTLFGRNSTGGAILVTTSDPSSEESMQLEASYASYNTQRYQVYATGGSETLAFDMAGLLRKSDGFVDNIITGSDDDAGYENSSLRLGAGLKVSDNLSLLLRYSYSDRADNSFTATNAYAQSGQAFATAAAYGAVVASEPGKVSNGFKPTFNGKAEALQLTVKADLDFALLTSYTQYREETATHHADFDMSALDIFHYIYDNIDRVFTQEFLLSSAGDGPLQWTAGLFYFSNASIFENNRSSVAGSLFERNGGSGVDVSTLAVFGDMTYAVRDNLYLTLGLRYSQDDIADAYFLNPGSSGLERTDVAAADDDQVAPRLALRYEPNEQSSVYLSYTEGYKSAIFNVGGGTLDGIEVDPEKIKAYEVGYKYNSGALVVDLASYYYDYQNLQVASYVGTASLIQNAANSNVFGVEGQVRYAISENLEVSLGANYLDAEYDQFDQSQVWAQCSDAIACGPAFGVFLPSYTDASGFEMQRAPELTANLGVSYTTEVAGGSFNLAGTLYHTSDFYFESSESYQQEAYDLLSLRAEWRDAAERYSVAVFGDNLTDEEYRNQVLPQFYGALSSWGAPRTVGVSLGLSF